MSPTKIEWSEETWNPTTGCDRVSPGCAHCYALTLAGRLKAMGQARYQKDGGRASGPGFGLTLHPDTLALPLRWKRPRRVFVDSMSDLFHEDVPDDFIDRVFAVMALTPQHTYQVLTKRPERMRLYLNTAWREKAIEDADIGARDNILWRVPLPNVWLGVTVENQHWANIRIPILLSTPAAVRFVSAEPLLGPVDLRYWVTVNGNGRYGRLYEYDALNWVIIGGESGNKHRPFNPDWARQIVNLCAESHTACFVKQMGGARPGNKLEDLPPDLRVREYPRDLPPPASKEWV